jgi:hypothetical protein
MAMKNATVKTVELGATRFHISGKRWFQKSAGNTYHSVQVSALVGEDWVNLGGVPFEYGYDEGYTQTGVDWLIENGYLDKSPAHGNGNPSHYGWPFRQDNNIDISVIDVVRKRDL